MHSGPQVCAGGPRAEMTYRSINQSYFTTGEWRYNSIHTVHSVQYE